MGRCAFRFLRLTTFLLAMAGFGLSGYLLYLHGLNMQGAAMPRFCGGHFDCSTVLQSSYAMVAGQIPVATFGILYFTLLAVWIMFVGRLPGKLHQACLWPALLGLVGVADSGYMVYVMGWRLHAWCSFCLATHAVNVLLCAGLWTQWLTGCRHRDSREVADAAQRQLWKIPALTVLAGGSMAVALLLLAGTMLFARKATLTANELAGIQQDPAYQRWQFLRTPSQTDVLAVAAGDPIRGPADAPHTLVMFGDFQCQGCAMTDKALRTVQQALGGSLRIVFKHYPWNEGCNPAVAGSNKHAFACQAARAAEAALRLGGNEAFWQMHDALYDNQDRLAEKPYAELAAQIGLDPAAFEKTMQNPSIRQRIEQDAAIGKALAIPGTPVLFLDGRRVTLDIITDPMGNEVDPDKTVAHWRNLVAAATEAAASQPVTLAPSTAARSVASVRP